MVGDQLLVDLAIDNDVVRYLTQVPTESVLVAVNVAEERISPK
jgi:hypothetical protein